MMANFADGGKTIIITGAPAPPPVAQEAPPPPPPANHANSGATAAAARRAALSGADRSSTRRQRHRSGHHPFASGERCCAGAGAAGTARAPDRGIAAGLLRNSDVAITLDQRATSANAARPALYIALHAANTGQGVHVFTSLLPAANLSPQGFLPWDTAQAAFLDLSGSVAGSVAAELESRKLPNTTLLAPLRPMNNIAAPAIAVEIAPPAGKRGRNRERGIPGASCAIDRRRCRRRAQQTAAGATMTRRVLAMFAVLAIIALGLAFYALHLKSKVARDEQLAAEQQQALAPPSNGPPTPVTLYIASDSDGTLRRTQMNVTLPPERTERDRAVLRALFGQYLQSSSPHPIGAGADVRDVYLLGDDTAIVDTNTAFAERASLGRARRRADRGLHCGHAQRQRQQNRTRQDPGQWTRAGDSRRTC